MPSAADDPSLTTSEKIILLKGSKIYDGHLFRPWDKEPAASEFQGEPFRDSYDYQLSSLQADILAAWRKPEIDSSQWQRSVQGKLDLVQDVTNDCSIVASLCVATARTAKMKSADANVFAKILFPFKSPSPNGKYVVKLQFNGCWRQVIIDDYLPESKNDQIMHVTARDDPSVIWPALIEKSLLKVMGGYDFPGSDSGNDLWTLIGWIPERIPLSNSSVGPEDLWRRVSTTFQYGDVMITLGTPKLSMLEENVYGLASGHDYAVIDMKEENDTKKLLIKNPWSRASDHLQAARKPNQVGLDVIVEDDEEEEEGTLSAPMSPTGSTELPGTRWMDMHEVFRRFETVYLSWNPNIFPHRRDAHFTYQLSERAASGAFTHCPQYSLMCESSCTVWLLLCRHIEAGQNRKNQQEMGYIGLYAYRSSTQILLGDRSVKKTPYVNSENVLLRLDIEAKTPYVIVVAEQDIPGTSANFTLSSFSTRRLSHFGRTPPKYAHTTTVEGNWSVSSAGGNANSPLHHVNPQWALTVSQPTDLALFLSTPKHEYSINVKLAWVNGRRIQPGMPSRDVYASSGGGEYRKAAALVEVQNVQPGTYTVVCSVYDTGYRAPFTLRLYATTPGSVALAPALSDDAGMFRHDFVPVIFRQGQDRVLCPLKVRQTCRLKVKAQQSASSSSASAGTGTLASATSKGVRSPLRIALEYGQGPDTQVLASSGEPRSDVHALTLSDVLVQAKWCLPPSPRGWLVVQRVGGAFVGHDEKVYVEVMCSADGLQAGQWGQETDLPVEELEKMMKQWSGPS